MLAVSDPAVVAPRVDGVILTLRMSKRARPTAERAKELLLAVGANIIGVAVNGVSGRAGGSGGYGYGYGYGYQYNYEYADEYADDPEEVEPIDDRRPPLKG
jgi:Mrp family chromosome partitioning ATPase